MRLEPLYRATFTTPEAWSAELAGPAGTEGQSFLIAEGHCEGRLPEAPPRRELPAAADRQRPPARLCAGLAKQVEAIRNRPLKGRYPYLWLDAKAERVRDGGRVVRKGL